MGLEEFFPSVPLSFSRALIFLPSSTEFLLSAPCHLGSFPFESYAEYAALLPWYKTGTSVPHQGDTFFFFHLSSDFSFTLRKLLVFSLLAIPQACSAGLVGPALVFLSRLLFGPPAIFFPLRSPSLSLRLSKRRFFLLLIKAYRPNDFTLPLVPILSILPASLSSLSPLECLLH